MYTVEYKYQIGQIVYSVDYSDKEIRTCKVLQTTIDLYSDSTGSLVQENSYIINLITGMDCSNNVKCDESELFETVAEAVAALSEVLN
jgi:hypothetical protein